LRRYLTLAPLVLLLAFVAYEGFAVARAHAKTPQVLALPRPLKLDQVSLDRQAALLTVDDPNFYGHNGLDFGTPGQGNTNLTQSLVKRFYFERFRPGFLKIEQMLIARFVLSPAASKRDQLELFYNYAYLGRKDGRDVIGFPAAARAWFGRDYTTLDEDQYFALVAMLIAPDRLDPIRHPGENAERVRRIKALLAARCRPLDKDDLWYRSC
jgi:membrane carboxypeptidase/penicillin-binding protein